MPFLIILGLMVIGFILYAVIAFITIAVDSIKISRKKQSPEDFFREQAKKRRLAEEEQEQAESEQQKQEEAELNRKKQVFQAKIRKIDREYAELSPDSPKIYNRIPKDKREILEQLATGKKYCIMPDGDSRDSILSYWLKYSGKKRLLIVTSPEKVDNFTNPLSCTDKWCSKGWQKLFKSYEVITWKDLLYWYFSHSEKHRENPEISIKEYAIAFDEVYYAKNGYRSNRGMAFMEICEETEDWVGFSSMIRGSWGGYDTFFVAARAFKNEYEFNNEYANFSYTPDGGKYISGYHNTKKLAEIWQKISIVPENNKK